MALPNRPMNEEEKKAYAETLGAAVAAMLADGNKPKVAHRDAQGKITVENPPKEEKKKG